MAGRPSKFNDALKKNMLALYESGKTDAEVARAIGVSLRTVHNWKAGNSAFLHSIREAKATADSLVEAALFRLAMGYAHPTEKIFFSRGKVFRVDTVKHYPPNVRAIMFWLRNRCPERWRF